MRKNQPTLFRRETLNTVPTRIRSGSVSSSDDEVDLEDKQQRYLFETQTTSEEQARARLRRQLQSNGVSDNAPSSRRGSAPTSGTASPSDLDGFTDFDELLDQ